MSQFNEVLEPIICDAYAEPTHHWVIERGAPPRKAPSRREACYYYRPPGRSTGTAQADEVGTRIALDLVNEIRTRVKAWKLGGWPGVTATTAELLAHWGSDDRDRKLFFCQREAAETVIFLVEARPDFRQGLTIPRDEPGGFVRYACKMATGSGKTAVMAMLAAWSILNKVADRSDKRFSDVVLVVCPNVTIRERLQELDPHRGEASLYRTRDIVPAPLMSELRKGYVLIENWHLLAPQDLNQVGGVGTRDVDFWTSKPVRESERSHLNWVVMDTERWEQTAAFCLDSDEHVVAFVKNFNLGFAIPYSHNGDAREYLPDFLARLRRDGNEVGTLILETKGYDPLAEVKAAAARRWVAAVNADGSYGRWAYRLVDNPGDVPAAIRGAAEELAVRGQA